MGLLEVLNGTASLDQALVRDTQSGALVLPLTKAAFTPRDVFGSEAMGRLLEELRSHCDVVLLDTAPILAVADTRVLCPQADAVVLLARWRKTSRKAVQSALHALSGETYVAGIALTNVNVREQALAGEGAAHYGALSQILRRMSWAARSPAPRDGSRCAAGKLRQRRLARFHLR